MKLDLKRKIDKLILNTFYILLVTLVIFIVAEVAARAYLVQEAKKEIQQQKRPDQDSEAYSYYHWREQFFEDKKKPGGAFRYETYSAWKHRDKNSELINIREGYRLSWKPEVNPARKNYTIYMFGGSTTYAIESPDEFTIASILAKKLNESSFDYRYLVRNYGVSAFVNDQEVHLLVKLLRDGHRPDAVIFYDGLNETQIKVALGRKHYFEAGYQHKLFSKRNWKARIRQIANRSSLFRLFKNPPSLIRSVFPFIKDGSILRRNAELMLDEYAENVRITKALAIEYGFLSFNFWGPSMFNTKKTLTPEEKVAQKFLPPDLYEADQLAHDIVAELVKEKSFFERTKVLDITHALDEVDETIFVDSNHITPIGNAAVAEAMLKQISSELR